MASPAVPPEVAENDILEVTIVQQLDDQSVLNVLHYVASDVTGTLGINTVATGIYGIFNDADGILDLMWNLQSTKLKYVGLRVQVIHPTRTAYWWIPSTDADGPELGADALPANVTGVITKRTAAVGQGNHGDFFLAGLATSEVENSRLKSGTKDTMDTLGEKIADTISPDGVQLKPIIFHGANVVANDYLMAAYAQPETRTMRRRTVGRGK